MHRDELLTEITRAFPDTPHPGEATQGISAAFGAQAWPTVPNEVLREPPTSLALLSPAGFRYYLPAFLCLALREPAHSGIEALLALLQLPIELGSNALAQLLARFEAGSPPPAAEVESLMQEQLRQTNRALNHFITRASRLTVGQGKAIYHFLTYLQEEGTAASRQKSAVAIERYWFQFA